MTPDVENIYEPPNAELVPEAATPPRRRLWKLYFWLFVPLTLFSIPWVLLTGRPQPVDYIDLLPIATSLVGLHAFVYRRAIGSEGFWRVFAPAVLLWDLLVLLVLIPAGLAYQHPDIVNQTAGEFVLSFFFNAPAYAALFLYGYRSPHLWRDDGSPLNA